MQLTPALQKRIKRLAAAGHSQVEIAKRTGVPKTTVWRVTTGKIIAKQENELKPIPMVKPYWCSGCNSEVYYKPCLVCKTRRQVEAKRK